MKMIINFTFKEYPVYRMILFKQFQKLKNMRYVLQQKLCKILSKKIRYNTNETFYMTNGIYI